MTKLLFFGDSLTDMGRDRRCEPYKAAAYGSGFVFCVASILNQEEPNKYQIINRGIGGNKVHSLYRRYKRDVIKHNPDVLTILIGVNDVWGKISLPPGFGTPINKFEEIYTKMILDIKEKLPHTRIILMEPFFLKGRANEKFFERFKEVRDYASRVKVIAEKTDCEFIPLQETFDELSKNGEPSNYLYDGVHTSPVGALIIANKWIEKYKNNA